MQAQNWEVEEGMAQFGGRQQEATKTLESLYQFLNSQMNNEMEIPWVIVGRVPSKQKLHGKLFEAVSGLQTTFRLKKINAHLFFLFERGQTSCDKFSLIFFLGLRSYGYYFADSYRLYVNWAAEEATGDVSQHAGRL